MSLCKYRDIFGKAHTLRLFNIAVVDTLLNIKH